MSSLAFDTIFFRILTDLWAPMKEYLRVMLLSLRWMVPFFSFTEGKNFGASSNRNSRMLLGNIPETHNCYWILDILPLVVLQLVATISR